jgi:hypothetical protein
MNWNQYFGSRSILVLYYIKKFIKIITKKYLSIKKVGNY